jgi:diguanylate cyclase (GGDEF)-like protein
MSSAAQWDAPSMVERAFEAAACGLLVARRDGTVVHANAAAVELVTVREHLPAPGAPRRLDDLFPPPSGTPGLTVTLVRAAARGIEAVDLPTVDATGRRRTLCWMVTSTVGILVLAVIDVTARRELGDQLAHLAYHDPLTGLPNRTLLLQRLEHALRRRERAGGQVAVLFLDLDRFKEINDTLGHDAGDQLLVALAGRIEAVLRPTDSVGRLSGDEFVVVCEDIADREAALQVVERMIIAVREPFVLEGERMVLTASIGMSLTEPGVDRDAVSLLREADEQMYAIKRLRDPSVARPHSLPPAAIGPDSLGPGDLRRAICDGNVTVVYQPQVSLADGHVESVECLVRWDHPEYGMLRPGAFLAMAEGSGAVIDLGRHVLGAACHQAARWARAAAAADRPQPVVSVNVSRTELADEGFPGRVAMALEASGLPPRLLRLEVAAPTLAGRPAPVGPALQRLRRTRVGISIDGLDMVAAGSDTLVDLPAEEMKLGPAAVRQRGDRFEPVEGVAELAAAAQDRGMRLVAAGVERGGQVEVLSDLGVEAAQGHWFAPPQSAGAATTLLEADVRFRRST